MKILKVGAIVLSYLISTNAIAGVEIKSIDQEDRQLGIAAVDSVVNYFQSIGYDINIANLDFSIIFENFVLVSTTDVNNENTGKRKVSGFYNADTREVRVFSFAYKREDRTPWGLLWSKEIAYSILQHEITHALIHHIKGLDLKKIDRVWNEYIAYGVQFAVMDADLRNRVLNGTKKTDNFIDNPWVVNYMTYAADTDKFSIMVHNTLVKGLFQVKDIIDNPPATITTEMFMKF